MTNIIHSEIFASPNRDLVPNFKIEIHYDPDPVNPRKEYDNVTTLVTWHRRYTLGDEQPSGEPEEYLRELMSDDIQARLDRAEELLEALSERLSGVYGALYNQYAWFYTTEETEQLSVLNATMDALAKGSTAYDRRVIQMEIKTIQNNAYRRECEKVSKRTALLDQIVEQSKKEGLDPYVIRELFLYDHSGLSISTGPFSCYWDSGPLGFAIVTKEKAAYEWGIKLDNPEFVQKVNERIDAEVKDYNSYLMGECYGYVIREDGDEIEGEQLDSCWGFLGDMDYCLEEAKSIAKYEMEHRLKKAQAVYEDEHRQMELAI